MLAGGIFCLRGSITAGDYAAYLLFVGLFTDPIKKLINFMEQLQSGMTGFERVQELMAVPVEEDSPNAVELDPSNLRGEINFEQVAFHYDNGHNVLKNLNLHIGAGQTIALVGPSGGGKSTLCHLIPRFYELESGLITLDGQDITSFTRRSLRQQIGVVQQETFLFTGTIRENIAYGDFGASDESIIAAAKAADIHDFIAALPEQYDTFVGERGVMLSGGQKQRIAIARVFLKNPPLLILDEATSALDNTSERNIQTALDSLSHGRTTLVVAHRLSTIMHADNIVVLTEQGITEQGRHEQLLQQGGIYARLWHAQSDSNLHEAKI
jgi:ATP-binding cassette subfamily B protein